MSEVLVKIDDKQMQSVFESQLANQYKIAASSAKERIAKLKQLSNTVLKYKTEIREALWKDLRKPIAEVDLSEIFAITLEVKHTVSHLKEWMLTKQVPTPLSLLGAKCWIQHEPKGVCLIIGPWNYPVQLALSPLVSAIAAGNTAIIKPSEFTPHSVVVMKKIIEEVFEKNEVALIEGGVDVATKLLSLPFNHIFFTGSPEVGKIVMSAAAKNLASVTLELGGKSPSIIDETADLKTIVPRLVWGKFANAGQICLAPDYVLVHESKKEELIAGLKKSITAYYGTDASASPDMARMINAANYKRVRSYIDEAVLEGANVVYGGRSIEEEKYIEPTIITDLDPNTNLMQKEIFGPVLPIIAYKDLNEAIALICSKEKPLALYIYSRNKKNIKKILSETRAGGTCINHNDIHFFNPHLPFGGSNNSGIGKAHGWFGFSAFSNERGVYKQIIPGAIDLLKPPYNNFKQRLIDLTIKWF